MMLAGSVRTCDLMLTIGQPTGGVPAALGEIGPFQMPSSRIQVAPVAGRDAELERAIVEIPRLPRPGQDAPYGLRATRNP